ncbi:hypothetical protein Mp_1g13800 [Marchantia polymorpha subsp. ruderalis]|uniref:5-formyltetrahydrofolate cyclo-ligase n=2 Tax=Marchantia polymorpha TaxID=3197 RepID=A0AAF6APV4_MARPO|nr:hypothetical protein MARPO_0019s0150 [Marchantia polymorpha]BBM98474.1 hypothetical protein Mp_1g13800 [Marchantia polymorpha subsp. ruderalis]|eukprot:PTQ44745.1 hypothetical protein MARPO_0019s0150 [Marchantia polymorpha]
MSEPLLHDCQDRSIGRWIERRTRVRRVFGLKFDVKVEQRVSKVMVRAFLLQRGMATVVASGVELLRQQKVALRTVMKRNLRNFPLELRQEEDIAIQNHVLSADWFKQSNSLCAYLSCASLREVDTNQIVASVLQKSDPEMAKELYVPRVLDREANMAMLHVSSTADLTTNSMGIVEPDFTDSDGKPRKSVLEATEPVDLLLLPGLIFDRSGRRCGRGGGYYDVFLQKYLQLVKDKNWKQPLLVAIAYSVQVVEDPVPVGETDIPVDALVLSSGVLPISPFAQKHMNISQI